MCLGMNFSDFLNLYAYVQIWKVFSPHFFKYSFSITLFLLSFWDIIMKAESVFNHSTVSWNSVRFFFPSPSSLCCSDWVNFINLSSRSLTHLSSPLLMSPCFEFLISVIFVQLFKFHYFFYNLYFLVEFFFFFFLSVFLLFVSRTFVIPGWNIFVMTAFKSFLDNYNI